MLVSTYCEDACPGDKGKVSLFGITLIPMVFNPLVGYFLHGDFRDECTIGWKHLKNIALTKKSGENAGNT